MLTLEEQTIERLERVRDRPSGSQGPCAALAWTLALYLIEAYHPILGLDFRPAGRSAPGQADWYGVRLVMPGDAATAGRTAGLIRFWDAAVADERPGGGGWTDLGRRFLQASADAAGALAEIRQHLGVPDRDKLPIPSRPPRWIFYLTLLRVAVDLLVDRHPVALSRGLDWPEIIPGGADPHPIRAAGVLGVRDSGAGEWIGLAGLGSVLFIHRRDARLIDRRAGSRAAPAATWLSDAGGQVGRYLIERLGVG